jgi:anthranilate/para-aminobenzoate synthase component II
MKILLVDNHTDYLYKFAELFRDHQVEIQEYRPGLDFHTQGKDLVILSGGGGEGYELKDKRGNKLWYEDEMNFVLDCDKPLVGICMGFEVISAAFGSGVEHVGRLVSGFRNHQTTSSGHKHLDHKKLRQYEHHRFAVGNVSSKHFEVLADSTTGIELIKHKSRQIVASQFHPEEPGGTLSLGQVLQLL